MIGRTVGAELIERKPIPLKKCILRKSNPREASAGLLLRGLLM